MSTLLIVVFTVVLGIGLGELLYRSTGGTRRRTESPAERLPRPCGCPTPPVPVQLSTGEIVGWLCPTCLASVPAPREESPPPPWRVVLVTANDGTDLGFHRYDQAAAVLRRHAAGTAPIYSTRRITTERTTR